MLPSQFRLALFTLLSASALATAEPAAPMPETTTTGFGSVLAEDTPIGVIGRPEWTSARRFTSTRVYIQKEPWEVGIGSWWRIKNKRGGTIAHRLLEEVEIGLPYRMQLDMYAQIEGDQDGDFHYQSFDVELRWAIADWGKIWGNPTLYAEYKFADPDWGPDVYEFKLLLGDSIALHAAIIGVVVKWIVATAGSGDPGAGATFTAASAGGLFVEAASGASPPAAPSMLPLPLPLPAPSIEPVLPLELLTSTAPPEVAPPLSLPETFSETAAAASENAPRAPRPTRTASGKTQIRASHPGAGAGGSRLSGTGHSGGSAGYVPPNFRTRYKPPYPAEARERRIEGTVLLLVSLDTRGRVIAARLQRTCGHAILDRAALAAVRSWLFDPARQNGTAIAAEVEVPIRFRFEARAGRRA